jgi:hypothetical protein
MNGNYHLTFCEHCDLTVGAVRQVSILHVHDSVTLETLT